MKSMAQPVRRRVIDLFSYGGPHYDRTLELRMHELSSLVDVFVVLEMGAPLSGYRDVTPLHFNPNLPAFAPFAARIVHVNLASRAHELLVSSTAMRSDGRKCTAHAGTKELPSCAKVNERTMRTRGAQMAYSSIEHPRPQNDVLLLSDVDEIPRARALAQLLGNATAMKRLHAGDVYALVGPCYYFDVECRVADSHREARWDFGPRVVLAATMLRSSWDDVRAHGPLAQPLPRSVQVHRVAEASWHFGYLMTLSEIRDKLCSNTDLVSLQACRSAAALKRIRHAMVACQDPFGRGSVPYKRVPARAAGHELPQYALAHLSAFTRLHAAHDGASAPHGESPETQSGAHAAHDAAAAPARATVAPESMRRHELMSSRAALLNKDDNIAGKIYDIDREIHELMFRKYRLLEASYAHLQQSHARLLERVQALEAANATDQDPRDVARVR